MSGDRSRIDAIVDALSREEKLSVVRGTSPRSPVPPGTAGYLPPLPEHDIGELTFVDGPLGVRGSEATAFPAAIALGAAFDPGLTRRVARAMGRETRDRGIDVLLAPGCNLVRVPQCGRTFEYYGEDPLHTARHTAAAVEGIQSAGVAATVKHYAANSQEHERTEVDAIVDERTLRELYLPAFEAAVDADVASVMASYNRVNGTYACQHERLLTDVLKEEYDLDGPVISDWAGVKDGVAAARAGLDLEMPGVDAVELLAMADGRTEPLRWLQRRWPDSLPSPADAVGAIMTRHATPHGMPAPEPSLFAAAIPDAVSDGRLSPDRLDDMVRRVLRLHSRVGALDGTRATVDADYDAHRDLAVEAATRGMVLLKNEVASTDSEPVLPLNDEATVAMIGPNVQEAKAGGGGSSEVTPTATVSPIDGVRDRSKGRVLAARGLPPIESPSTTDFEPDPAALLRRSNPSITKAVAIAERADVAIVVVQDAATEGRDRRLVLPDDQDQLVAAVADAANRTVVVLQTAGPVEMPWLEAVDAVLEAWYPGQEAGRALSRVLYGDSDPGGRLPVTFGRAAGDYPANARAQYPGVIGASGHLESRYTEGVFVGYRGFDERGIEPLFPFGHGLSYAEFEYRDVAVPSDTEGLEATVSIQNKSDRPGHEVVQVYAEPADTEVPRPPRELAGFASVWLPGGGNETVTVPLEERAFGYYDVDEGCWVHPGGEREITISRSSRDSRWTGSIVLE